MAENNSLRRAAVTQHADTLSTEIDIVPPVCRMKHLALERLDSLYFWVARDDQYADGGHESSRVRELLLARTHITRLDAPHIRVRIPLGLVDRRMELAVGTQGVLVDHAAHILQYFGLCAVRVAPVRVRVGGE